MSSQMRVITHAMCGGRALRVFSLCVVAAALVGGMHGAASGALTATPDKVVFSSLTDSAVIHVLRDGKPTPPGAITRTRVLIENKDYGRMFDVSVSRTEPGVIIVKARPAFLEMGSYELRIEAGRECVSVALLAPLDKLPDTLENLAASGKTTVEALRLANSLSQYAPRENVTIDLPPAYTEGDTLRIPLDGKPDRCYTWAVNGEIISSEMGDANFTYTFGAPGAYSIAFTEQRGKAIVAKWQGKTNVTPEPDQNVTAERNTELQLAAPEGYGMYEWTVDGKSVNAQGVLSRSFPATGQYTVQCTARKPTSSDLKVFRRIVWKVAVR